MLSKELKQKLDYSKFVAYCNRNSKCLVANCPIKFKVITSTALFICPKGYVLPITQEVPNESTKHLS